MISLKKQSNTKITRERVILYMNYVQCEQRMCSTNQTHLKDIECQMKTVNSLRLAAKIRKCSVYNISHDALVIYMKKFTIVNILG